MSVLAAFLLAQASSAPVPLPPPSAEEAEQIVVIGNRLKTWRGGVFKRDGKLTCRTRKSSGDKEIDAMRCGAMLRCIAPRAAEMDRIAASDLAKEERDRQLQAVGASAQPCVEAADAVGIRLLATRRVKK